MTNNTYNNSFTVHVYKGSSYAYLSKSGSYPMLTLDDIMLAHSEILSHQFPSDMLYSPNAIFTTSIIFCAFWRYCTTYQDSRLYTILELLHKADGNCCLSIRLTILVASVLSVSKTSFDLLNAHGCCLILSAMWIILFECNWYASILALCYVIFLLFKSRKMSNDMIDYDEVALHSQHENTISSC